MDIRDPKENNIFLVDVGFQTEISILITKSQIKI